MTSVLEEMDDAEQKNLLYLTDRYILRLTEDRAGPYWTHRLKWITMMLDGAFYEPPAVKDRVIYTTAAGTVLTFRYIMESGIYNHLVCDAEIGKTNNVPALLNIRHRLSTNQPVTPEEAKAMNRVLYTGTTVASCMASNFRSFRKKYGTRRQSPARRSPSLARRSPSRARRSPSRARSRSRSRDRQSPSAKFRRSMSID